MAGYCERLVEAGLPLWRVAIGSDTLHPLIGAQGHHWMAGQGVHQELYPRAGSPEQEADWRDSPGFASLRTAKRRWRRRLALGEGTNEFPLLASLADKGGTDYWARDHAVLRRRDLNRRSFATDDNRRCFAPRSFLPAIREA